MVNVDSDEINTGYSKFIHNIISCIIILSTISKIIKTIVYLAKVVELIIRTNMNTE